MNSVRPRHLALLIGITFLWGLNLVVSRVGMAQVPPVLYTLLRMSLIAALLLPWLKRVPGQMNALVVATLLSGGLNFALLFVGLSLAKNVSSVAIASQLGVPMTTLLSIALLDEKVRWRRWTGIALSFAGVLVMGMDPQVFDRGTSLALVVASAFVGALGLIAIKKLDGVPPLQLQAWMAWVSVPVLLLITVFFEHTDRHTLRAIGTIGWGAVIYTAVAGTLVAHTCFYWLLQRYPVTSVAPLTVLSPLFSVALGMLVLHDQVTLRIAIGGLITLSGVVIVSLRERHLVDIGS
jgi:O-acetylserine/cysteine efflux transporter